MSKQQPSLRIPEAMRDRAMQIIALTDQFCAEHLDAEYAELCRKLVAKLARKRPSPLARGDLRVWAGATVYVVGGVNFLFDKSQKPYLSADDLSRLIGVAKSTLANKARQIRDLLDIGVFEPEFSRRAMLEQNPLSWMVMVNGLIMDVRDLPPELQEEARRRGLIPDLPLPGPEAN
ncbi:MAG: hypothetical protein HY690_15300 [Chloroflexi bacterium]|nr:hypothetical protein [Chloroflexota bacterium]